MVLSTAQLRVQAMVYWAKLITCKVVDLTREGQRAVTEWLEMMVWRALIGRLQEAYRGRLLEAYFRSPPLHDLGPT